MALCFTKATFAAKLFLRRLGDEFEQKRRQGLAFHPLALGRKQGLFGGASRVKTGRFGHRVGDQHASCEPKAPLGMHRARHVRWRICAVGHRKPASRREKCRELVRAVPEHRDALGFEDLQGLGQIQDRLRPRADHGHVVLGDSPKSALMSHVSATPRCTPPMPPVTNTPIPAKPAPIKVPLTVVAPKLPWASTTGRSRRDTLDTPGSEAKR